MANELLLRLVRKSVIALAMPFLGCGITGYSQQNLYAEKFSLSDVRLLDGPFKHARDLNIETLLQYDVDRLLAPFRKVAGLTPKATSYSNWIGLDGHVAGHYLSALAMNVAATGNEHCKRRIRYMVEELWACQQANQIRNPDWGIGYIGGVPNSDSIWRALRKGEFRWYREAWVPWYNLHKMYAGLRDLWSYTGNDTAKKMFLAFCDWGINITAGLSETQMQEMLDIEHGGMNEVFADAYYLTSDRKYLAAAKRFSHWQLLDALSIGKDNLDNKHANTQVPKAVGFLRIGELSGDTTFLKSGQFFWETVTGKRSLAFGGNSRREFFPSVAASTDFIYDVEGPETCNSYNMLKLTEGLYRKHPSSAYVEYYERTLFNHILASQHPVHGGYVYFTPVRPRHYRVYSSPNQGMWCCVGSGMESQSKYNEFIYTHQGDSLFVNLFIASELNWKAKGVRLTQQTQFPFKEIVKLQITAGPSAFTLVIRRPSWVKENGFVVKINGGKYPANTNRAGFIYIKRKWAVGDVLEVSLPMTSRVEPLPNVPQYIALLHGPIVLAASMGTENMDGLVAGDGRWAHIASGKRLPVDLAPLFLADSASGVLRYVKPVVGQPLTFEAEPTKMIHGARTVFRPFFQMHDRRYMMYWLTLSPAQYQSYLDSLAIVEREKVEISSRTIDMVRVGEQQPEADHSLQRSRSNSGNHLDEFWRDARDSGFFSYNLTTNKEKGLTLLVKYWGAEWGNRAFDIYIDDMKFFAENNTSRWNQSQFKEVLYAVPDSLIAGKDNIRIKFQALPNNTAGAVYQIRLLRRKT